MKNLVESRKMKERVIVGKKGVQGERKREKGWGGEERRKSTIKNRKRGRKEYERQRGEEKKKIGVESGRKVQKGEEYLS